MNAFSPDLQVASFVLGRNTGWEANVTEKNVRCQGKEYKISRELLPNGVKMAGGLIVVNKTMGERATFPDDPQPLFSDADAWRPLVLIPAK